MEEDPVLLADDRRHALLALTQLGRIALAEFARQADPTKYQPYVLKKGPRKGQTIFRNPATGARMDQLPQGYEVQEGQVTKSQGSAFQSPSLTTSNASLSSPEGRMNSLEAILKTAAHPELSHEDLEKATRHVFGKATSAQEIYALASRTGVYGARDTQDAINQAVTRVKASRDQKQAYDRMGRTTQVTAEHLPKIKALVRDARVQEQTETKQRTARDRDQAKARKLEKTKLASEVRRLSGT
jgi:hypothetical protein